MDHNQEIELIPLSPWGYERKHTALHKAGDYEKALEAIFSKMSQSSDPRALSSDAIRGSPRVLINTISGRLLDKSEQAAAFESLPLFNELISSTTTNIDHTRVVRDVGQYYRYAMFSHNWEDNELLFDQVIRTVVYDLEESLTRSLRTPRGSS
ncbi:hypothetical protein EV363DRAFT_1452563 [Boletus edulis]|nr:hypothetical protein EV363DRAFT_1452563 [Boletus edulis]